MLLNRIFYAVCIFHGREKQVFICFFTYFVYLVVENINTHVYRAVVLIGYLLSELFHVPFKFNFQPRRREKTFNAHYARDSETLCRGV